MKKTGFWRGFGLGLILTVAVTALSVSAMAATASRTIQVEEGVQISLNGATFVPRDAKGNEVSVFLYNGTTYVPLELFVVLMGNPADAVTADGGAVELTAEAAGSGAQLPSPWEEYGSLSGLEQAAGFPVPLPVLPEGVEAVLYQAIPGQLAEVRFSGGVDTLIYRAGPGTEDMSGDYNVYPAVQTVEEGGVSVTCKGDGDTVSLALWSRDGYSFSLASERGLDMAAVRAAVSGTL